MAVRVTVTALYHFTERAPAMVEELHPVILQLSIMPAELFMNAAPPPRLALLDSRLEPDRSRREPKRADAAPPTGAAQRERLLLPTLAVAPKTAERPPPLPAREEASAMVPAWGAAAQAAAECVPALDSVSSRRKRGKRVVKILGRASGRPRRTGDELHVRSGEGEDPAAVAEGARADDGAALEGEARAGAHGQRRAPLQRRPTAQLQVLQNELGAAGYLRAGGAGWGRGES